jgi:hypothetical protein
MHCRLQQQLWTRKLAAGDFRRDKPIHKTDCRDRFLARAQWNRQTNVTINRPRLRLGIFRSSLFGPLPAIPIRAASCERDAGGPSACRGFSRPRFLERVFVSPRSSLFRCHWNLLFAAMTAVAFCGYLGWSHFYGNDIGRAASGKANGLPRSAAIPVTIAQAAKTDFPVYLNGLGAAEPYETVLGSGPIKILALGRIG